MRIVTDVDVGAGGEASGDVGATCVTVHGCGVAGVGKACCMGCGLSVSSLFFFFFFVLVPFAFHGLFLPLPAV